MLYLKHLIALVILINSPLARADLGQAWCGRAFSSVIPFPVPKAESDVFKNSKKKEFSDRPLFYTDGILDLSSLSFRNGNQLMLAYAIEGKGLAGLSFSGVAPVEFGPIHSLVLQHPNLDLTLNAQAAFSKLLEQTDHREQSELSARYTPFHVKVLQTSFQSKPSQTLWVFDLSKPRTKDLPAYVRGIEESFFNFVFEHYRGRMGMKESTAGQLLAISQDAISRTTLIIGSPLELMHFDQPGGWGSATYGKAPETLPMSGGLSVVTSNGIHQKLPLESFTGFVIPRRKGEILAEIGRFVVARNSLAHLSAQITLQVASMLRGMREIDRVIVEADEARAQIFTKFGFKPIHSQINFQGKKEYVLSVTTQDLYQKALEQNALSKDHLLEALGPRP